MSCRTALISVGLSCAAGMVLLVLLLEGVGVGVLEAVAAPPFMLRSVGPVGGERSEEGSRHLAWHLGGAVTVRRLGGLLGLRRSGLSTVEP